MTSVKVVDLNEEVAKVSLNSNNVEVEAKEEAPVLEEIEEANKVGVEQHQPEIINEVNEEVNEEVKEDVKQTPKAKPKPKASDLVFCPDCNRQMTYKNLRYSHKCSPEPPPVKKQANPKGKAKAKPKVVSKPPPEVYYSESEEEEEVLQPVTKKKIKQQVSQPVNPVSTLAQQYQLLQQQMMQQKQERYNKRCQGMFAPRTKKR